jgi:hypothetical protein
MSRFASLSALVALPFTLFAGTLQTHWRLIAEMNANIKTPGTANIFWMPIQLLLRFSNCYLSGDLRALEKALLT